MSGHLRLITSDSETVANSPTVVTGADRGDAPLPLPPPARAPQQEEILRCHAPGLEKFAPIATLDDEFLGCMLNAASADFHALVAAGVPRDWLWTGAGKFGVANIQPRRSGLYDPDPDGRPAVILPVYPLVQFEPSDVFDLVAFRPDRPTRWWLRQGLASILNPHAVERAACTFGKRESLKVWSTPLDWMRGGGEGIVILEDGIRLRSALAGVDEIVAGDLELGSAIERRMQAEYAAPRILVKAS